MLKAAPNIQICMNHVLSGVEAIQVPGGYARASYASGGGGASRVPRIAGGVTAGLPLPAACR